MHTCARRADVARAVGVAESTVSRALSDSPLISDDVKRRVREAAQRLGYVPSRQAARFARRRTYHLGFVVRSYASFAPFSRAYFPALLDGAVLGAEERGYHVTVVLDRRHDDVDEIAGMVSSREVDGLLLSVTPADDDRVLALKKRGIPCVLINNYMKGMSSVDGDPRAGMRLAFEHALELGHARLGYVTGDMAYRNAVDRLAMVHRLAEEHGVKISVAEGNFSRTSGYIAAGKLLQSPRPPSLIMTAADREAMGVLDYCRQHRLRVPEDVSVIGYDNLEPARTVSPGLTTVDNPVTRAGLVGAQLLIDTIEGKTKRPVARWLETGFVVRESTGRCAGSQQRR
ncbi:MAG: LacI family DNA-binding transcriptional regulator, partial [Chitinivibrionales bacterium]|nr:LacI family DNA-binding transcriptional regulator [Chitinivibrionales bacterium]